MSYESQIDQLNVTELDFDKIKRNLTEFLKGQDKFNDYNYEGSGMSILLDILAYNTHYNAMAGHIDVNESFLRSAQLRHNVVGRAMPLGYVPRSQSAATVAVDLIINSPVGAPPPTNIDLNRGARLTTNIDGVQYPYTVLVSINAQITSDNTYEFNDVVIYQGELKTSRFRVDSTVESQRFIIPDTNVDMSNLRVRVREHDDSSTYSVYIPFNTFAQLDGDTPVYFTEEISTGEYAVYFGDGLIGKRPNGNNIIEIEYLSTKGKFGNGANNFTFASDIQGNTDIDVLLHTPNSQSSGGAERESIESIRFNAPLTYISQNRAVTSDDYKAILIKEYGDIEAISTWGGEDNSPPDYGKVYIAIKPKSGDKLTPLAKTNITNLLKGKNVVSISPAFADPTFTKLELQVFFKYNPNLTENTQTELQSIVSRAIEQYNNDNLRDFSGVFRYSQLLRTIDRSDTGILNSTVRVQMYKDIIPDPAKQNVFDLQYAGAFYITVESEISISTTPFLINGIIHYIGDEPIGGDLNRRLFVYKLVDEIPVKVIRDVGTLNATNGTITIHSFRPDNDDPIRIMVTPLSYDIAPKRNQLVQIDNQVLQIFGSVDTIATGGASGAINYQTTPRN